MPPVPPVAIDLNIPGLQTNSMEIVIHPSHLSAMYDQPVIFQTKGWRHMIHMGHLAQHIRYNASLAILARAILDSSY